MLSDKDKPTMAKQSLGELDDGIVNVYSGKPTRLVTKQKLSVDEKTVVKEPKPRVELVISSGNGEKKAPITRPVQATKELSSLNKPSVQREPFTHSTENSPQRQNHSDSDGVNTTEGRKVDSKVGRVSDQDVRDERRRLADPIRASQEENLRIERAVRFLRHPSILPLSPLEKQSYLRSKGLSDVEIDISKTVVDEGIKGDLSNSSNMDGVWKNNYSHTSSNNFDRGVSASTRRDTFPHTEQLQNRATSQQEIHTGEYVHPSSYYSRPKSENPELPNPFVPLTIGGMIALFGLAALRWLNGGDFVLFPPSTTTANNLKMEITDDSSQSGSEQECREAQNTNVVVGDMDTSSNVPSLGELEQTREYNDNSLAEDDKIIDQCKEQLNEASKSAAFQPNTLNSDLPIELRNLTKAIETHSSIQERTLQHSLNEKAKNVTDTAMNLLRHHGTSSPTAQEKVADPTEEITHHDKALNTSLDLTILVQITEIKCALNAMKDEIKNTKSTNPSPHVQSVKSHNEGDKGDMDASEPYDAIHDALNKLEKMSATLSHIESKLLWKGNPIRQKLVTDIKHQAVTKKCENHSTTNANKITPEEQETESIDNQGDTSPLLSNHDNKNQDLSSALEYFVKENTIEQVQSCAQMLYMYAMNLSSNPDLPRYRKVYTNNTTFKKKVDTVKGARNILIAVGFVDQGSYFEWKGDEIIPDTMGETSITLLKQAAEALSLLKHGNQLNNETVGVKTE